MTQPTASRIVAALERQVGVELLMRSTRAVTLTEAGTDYLARSEMILAALDEADHAARGTGELRGTLRVATSPSFAARTVMPCLLGSRTGTRSCASNSGSMTPSTILLGILWMSLCVSGHLTTARPSHAKSGRSPCARRVPNLSRPRWHAALAFRLDRAHGNHRTGRQKLRRLVIPQGR
jgi:DNA-binding transcriptional LysR family regulator